MIDVLIAVIAASAGLIAGITLERREQVRHLHDLELFQPGDVLIAEPQPCVVINLHTTDGTTYRSCCTK